MSGTRLNRSVIVSPDRLPCGFSGDFQAPSCIRSYEDHSWTVRQKEAAYFLIKFWPVWPRVQLVAVCSSSLGACC